MRVCELAASDTCCSLQQAAAEVTEGHNGRIMRLRLKEGSHFKSQVFIGWVYSFICVFVTLLDVATDALVLYTLHK